MRQPKEAFQEGGLEFMLYHPGTTDFAVFNETIFPEEVRFIAQHPTEDRITQPAGR